MSLSKQTHLSEQAISLATSLLTGTARYRREGNVVADISALLSAVGIDSSEIEREHPAENGRIDLYLPRYRTIFEAKAKGKAADPNKPQPAMSESPREQMERYVKAEVHSEFGRLSPEGKDLSSVAEWTGIVTDGQDWHVWSYPHARDAVERRQLLHSGPVTGGASDLISRLRGWLEREPVGRAWIPADPSHLFAGKAKELAHLYSEMPTNIRSETDTKRALWHEMLRVSGMSPKGKAAPDRLFVTHSLLIAIARMVTHSTAHRKEDWKLALRDGFASWMFGWPQVTAWTEQLWNTVSHYDWRRRQGDVLRVLYEEFVPEVDRKVFGEFYTPNWLAAMMVEHVLDDQWLQDAIEGAEDAIQNRTEFKGRGVLDPSCGSGTFLYHAALRILDAPAMRDLRPTQRADVTALLLNGIDVHPVAIEIAKANLMRALPAEPSAGESALRVHLGDSLLTGEDKTSLFGHVEGSMRLVTPRDREILIPVEFVKQDGFADSMRRLVDAAASGKPVPRAVLNRIPRERREELLRSRDELEAAIGAEGNSVWTWYAVNVAAPHLLSERKVDRIVANPPWVALSGIQEPERKRTMERLAQRMGLQAGGKQAPNLDIATFFVLRSRELYLNAPDSDPAIWLVKKSALRAGHWERFRTKHSETLAQSVDLESLQPFGGGDARRCCLLMEHCQLGEPPAPAPALAAEQRASAATRRLEARLRSLPSTAGQPKKPKPVEHWTAVRDRILFQAAAEPLPQAPSDYFEVFRRGAAIFPHVLLVVEEVFPQASKRIRVRTKKSLHSPWDRFPPQDIELPKRWLSRLFRSPDTLLFIASARTTEAIIPLDEQGNLDLQSALDEPGWEALDGIYRRCCGKGRNTPQTLAEQIDFAGKLSSQRWERTSGKRMVLYPKSGDLMRAARVQAGDGFADDTLYWHVASSGDEAGYLTALLNAPCLQRAFLESRESGRHFDLHPWRKVPIPRYDSNDGKHLALAELCECAEKVARDVAAEVAAKFPRARQPKLSSEVRASLEGQGILSTIDSIAAQLLPSQAET